MMKISVSLLMCLAVFLLVCPSFASADTLNLPDSTVYIDEEAFAGDTSFTSVIIPDGVLGIGPRAFSGTMLEQVTLPDTVLSIADDAFDGHVVLTAAYGSFAYHWALGHGILQVRETPASDFVYEISDGEVTITKYSGTEKDVYIPETIDGYPVTAVAGKLDSRMWMYEGHYDPVFENPVEYVEFPDTVIRLGDSLFYGNHSLKEVRLPQNLTGIPDRAFYGCAQMEKVSVPDTVTDLGGSAFYACTALREIGLSAHLKRIGTGCFQNCSSLEQLDFPADLTEIAAYAFRGCLSLTGLTLPAGVNRIPQYCFADCEKLSGIRYLGKILSIGDRAFSNTGFTEFVVPGDAEYPMGTGILAECKNLTRLIVSSGVKRVDKGTCWECPALESVSLPEGLTQISPQAFSGCISLARIALPSSLTYIGYEAFYGCSSLDAVSLPEGLKDLDFACFANCTGLTSISLPNQLDKVSDKLFMGCVRLKTVGMSTKTDRIYSSAFQDCRLLSVIQIPDGVKRIDDNAFLNCVSLESISIPASVSSIYGQPFLGCSSLKKIGYEPGSAAEAYVKKYTSTYPLSVHMKLNESCAYTVHFLDGIQRDYSIVLTYGDAVSIEENTLTAVASGNCTCRLQIPDLNISQNIEVYVNVSLNRQEMKMNMGETASLYLSPDLESVPGAPAVTGEMAWSSSNDSVVSVDQQGNVTALHVGGAEITLTVPTESGDLTASCLVTVAPTYYQQMGRRSLESLIQNSALDITLLTSVEYAENRENSRIEPLIDLAQDIANGKYTDIILRPLNKEEYLFRQALATQTEGVTEIRRLSTSDAAVSEINKFKKFGEKVYFQALMELCGKQNSGLASYLATRNEFEDIFKKYSSDKLDDSGLKKELAKIVADGKDTDLIDGIMDQMVFLKIMKAISDASQILDTFVKAGNTVIDAYNQLMLINALDSNALRLTADTYMRSDDQDVYLVGVMLRKLADADSAGRIGMILSGELMDFGLENIISSLSKTITATSYGVVVSLTETVINSLTGADKLSNLKQQIDWSSSAVRAAWNAYSSALAIYENTGSDLDLKKACEAFILYNNTAALAEGSVLDLYEAIGGSTVGSLIQSVEFQNLISGEKYKNLIADLKSIVASLRQNVLAAELYYDLWETGDYTAYNDRKNQIYGQ